MKTRNKKKRCKKFIKRAYNQNTKTIRILWPMIKNLQGKSNDFLFIVLKTLAANRAVSNVYRIKQLMRGFFLNTKPVSWNTFSLTVNEKTNWFVTCRDSNLEIIGPMLGCYLRTKAAHFCQSLSTKWNISNQPLDDTENVFAICDKAVIPFVVELSLAERTVKHLEQFVHISDDILNNIKVDEPTNDTRSRKMVMHEIRHEYHNWAWACLNTGDVVPLAENSSVPSSESIDMFPSTSMSEPRIPGSHPLKTRSGRLVKKKKIFE